MRVDILQLLVVDLNQCLGALGISLVVADIAKLHELDVVSRSRQNSFRTVRDPLFKDLVVRASIAGGLDDFLVSAEVELGNILFALGCKHFEDLARFTFEPECMCEKVAAVAWFNQIVADNVSVLAWLHEVGEKVHFLTCFLAVEETVKLVCKSNQRFLERQTLQEN